MLLVKKLILPFATLLLISTSANAQPKVAQPIRDSLHAWNAGNDPVALENWVNQHLAKERSEIEKLLSVPDPRTVANTLRPYDDAVNQLAIAGNNALLMYSVADTAAMRDKGQALEAEISSAATDLSLNQPVYRALSAIPLPDDDAATKHYIERTLLEYRLAGVDKDNPTRARIRQLQDKITSLSLVFGRNVADGKLSFKVSRSDLDGLPDDYIARHKAGADGSLTLTTDEPDFRPVLKFAKDPKLRLKMYLAYFQRADPKNVPVLMDLLRTRQELATTLGYPTYADLSTADQMMGSSRNVTAFLQEVDEASRPIGQREYSLLLMYAQEHQPSLTSLSQADANFWSEQYRRAKYDFNSESVRPYFPYHEVQAGIITTASRLFHIAFRAVTGARTWNSSISTFDVFDTAEPTKGKKLGRIYLDMHPREGKDKWFSSAPLVPGIRGQQLPEGVLICNFPGGVQGDPGLMEYDDVVTFFHEFGHLMHHILGGQGRWSGEGGFNVEGDFIEAPSQMLEEMFRDRTILASFAKDYKSGAIIPAELIEKMNRASAYGRGNDVRAQLNYATFMLQIHDRPPSEVDLDRVFREDAKRFRPFEFVDGNHYYSSFTWVTGYASNVYTYLLDEVIALDFFSQFDKNDLLDGPVAMRYRRTVLEPGASAPAAELIRNFLRRPQNIDAMKSWMSQEFASGSK
jgi:Zn-dependent oligopeptidase